jgi:hypothetical protein
VTVTPLLRERSPVAQIALAVGGPLIFGAICGAVLSVSGPAYTTLTIIALLGGVLAGFDHLGANEGAVRGFCAGLVFGVVILATHALIGGEPKAKLPHPHGGLVFVTVIASIIAGSVGGALRARRERKLGDAGAQPARPA